MSAEQESRLAVFEGRQIRKVFHEGEWWFSIIDVVEVLVGGERPRKYWNDLKKKLSQEGYDQLSEKIGQLKMRSADGKLYATDCANTETLFRIIQSIPSPKVEPLKRWLARVGRERRREHSRCPQASELSRRPNSKKVRRSERNIGRCASSVMYRP
jgi:DNA-damage-inducible protein D